MNSSSKKALHYLTGYDDIDAVSVEELQRLVEENPYFPVTRFLLTQKLQAQNNLGFLTEAQKTALYYSNVHWLHYQLSNASSEEIVTAGAYSISATTGIDTEELSEAHLLLSTPRKADYENRIISANDEEHPITTEFSHDELEAASNLAHETLEKPSALESNDPAEHPITTKFSKDELEAASDLAHETLHDTPEHSPASSVPQQDLAYDTPEISHEEEAAAMSRDVDGKFEQSVAGLETLEEVPIRDNFEQAVLDSLLPSQKSEVLETSDEVPEVSSETTNALLPKAATLEKVNIEEHSNGVENGSNRNYTSKADELPQKHETAQLDEHERMFQNIKAMLDASSEEADADVENSVVPIDPYYTIDYFASQGIKLELEKNPQDQLGKNLKKFTQWLKHMKKLGPEDATEVIIKKETEADIVKIADSSNTAREVVTEAMASVLEKQGKKDKAIELYNKLSFLNPGKSAYFAHKIKNLNGI